MSGLPSNGLLEADSVYRGIAVIYAALCLVHLAACALEKDRLCAVTKCPLMPLLAACVISFALSHSAVSGDGAGASIAMPEGALHGQLILVAVALLFATAGDALLLSTSDSAFMAGAGCFLAGHTAWMLTMRHAVAACPVWGIVAWAAASIALLFVMWRVLGKPRGVMGAGVMVYGLFLSALVGTGVAAVLQSAHLPSFMFLAGGVLFFISDGVLAYDRFARHIRRSNFVIMLTYTAAQTLLAFSVIARA